MPETPKERPILFSSPMVRALYYDALRDVKAERAAQPSSGVSTNG